jgi:hypothetical protein
MSKLKGWAITESIGVAVVNPRGLNKLSMDTFKIIFFKEIPGTNVILYLFKDLIQSTHHISYTVVSNPNETEIFPFSNLTRNVCYENSLARVLDSSLDFPSIMDFLGRPESEILQLSVINNPNLRHNLSVEAKIEIRRENNPFWAEFLEEALNIKKSHEVIES